MRQYLPRRSIAQFMGGSYSQIMRTLAYWNLINSAIILVLGWNSGTGQELRQIFPWMTFIWFVLIAVGIFLFASLVDFFFILPAIIAFNNRQSVKHDNPVWAMMADMQRDIKEIKGRP